MSRAQSTQVFNQATGNSKQDTANAQSLYGTLVPSLTGQLQNPGYTPAQQNAITGATEGGIGAAFGSASEGAANRAARTNNAAGLAGQEDALARQRMITSGNLGAQNQETFANTALSEKARAQAGLGQLFGENLNASNAALGEGNQASTANKSFWDQFGGAFASGLGGGLGKLATPVNPYAG
jgi:hypothetical protein